MTVVKKNWIYRNFGFYGLYYHICHYGESYTRPLVLSALILFEATMYFWHNDVVMNDIPNNFELGFSSFQIALQRSLSTIFPFFELNNTDLEDYGLRIILLPILATIFIGLRRKLERRFRH